MLRQDTNSLAMFACPLCARIAYMYQLCSGWDYAHFLSWSMWSPKSLLHSKDLLALLSVHLFDIPVQRLHNLLYHIQDFHLIPENCPAIRSQNAVHLQQQIFQLASVCVWCAFSKVKNTTPRISTKTSSPKHEKVVLQVGISSNRPKPMREQRQREESWLTSCW